MLMAIKKSSRKVGIGIISIIITIITAIAIKTSEFLSQVDARALASAIPPPNIMWMNPIIKIKINIKKQNKEIF